MRERKVYLYIILFSILLECFIFNSGFFAFLLSNKGETVTYASDTLDIEQTSSDKFSVEIKDINMNCADIYLDMECDVPVHYVLQWADVAGSEYCTGRGGSFYTDVEDSKYIKLNLSGETKKLKIAFETKDANQLVFNGVTLNKLYPFHFSVIRMLIVFAIFGILYAINHSPVFLEPSVGSRNQKIIIGVLILFFLFLCSFLAIKAQGGGRIGLRSSGGDLYNKMLVDAFASGHTYLDKEIEAGLEDLPDIYDFTVRNKVGIDPISEYSYYNGHYYLYFGPTACILLFLPFYLITGYYLQMWAGVLFFLFIFIISSSILFCMIMKRFCKQAPFAYTFLGIIALNATGGALWLCIRPMYFEIAFASGFAFCATGILLAYLYGFEQEGKRHKWLMTVSGACLGLAVGCRATLILSVLLLIPLFWMCKSKKERLQIIIWFLPFYILIGSALAAYNYARFGNILQFGVDYQLTALNFQKQTIHFEKLPFFLWHCTLQPFFVNTQFPYIDTSPAVIDYVGDFYFGARPIPLFWMNPILLFLLVPGVLKKVKKVQTKPIWNGCILSIGIGAFVFCITSLSAGICARYSTEAILFLTTPMLLMVFSWVSQLSDDTKHTMNYILAVFCFFSLFCGFAYAIRGEANEILKRCPLFWYTAERFFSFWK